VRGGGEQGLIVGVVSKLIGGSNTVDGGPDNGVAHGILDPLAKQVELMVYLSHALDVFFCGFHGVFLLITFLDSLNLLFVCALRKDVKG